MNQPRRILHVISRLDEYRATRPLVDLALAQAVRGEQPVVAALAAAGDAADRLRSAGVDVAVLGRRWPLDAPALARLRRLLRSVRPAVVHSWGATALIHFTACRPRGDDAPLLATIDSADAAPGWQGWAIGKLRDRAAAWAVADERARAWIAEQGVAEQRIEVISPGVAPPPSLSLTRTELLDQLALPRDAQLIVTAGPLVRRNRFDDAIWCFELVRVLHANVRLLIIGDGPDRHRLERFAQQASEPDCIRFLGHRPDAAGLIALADIYWQLNAPASPSYEMLDAMAAGATIVASEAPGHAAAIRDGENGRLVPAGNRAEVARAADELLRNPELARTLAAAAAADAARRWPLDAMTAAYDQLYRRLLSAPGDADAAPRIPVTLRGQMP